MSFSEHYRRANREDSTRPKNNIVSSDLSFMPSNDLVELVWENGQILMQGQSSRSGKTSNSDTFKSRGSDFPLLAPSCEIGAGHDDDMIRWLNFHINDDSMEQAYCSDLLTGLSGVTEHEISASQTEKSFPFYRSSSNDTSSCTQSSVCADLTRVQTSSSEKLQNRDMGLPISSSGLLNFSHFSQLPGTRKTNIHKNGPSPPNIVDKDKSAVTGSSTGLCNRMSSNTQINITPNNVREKSSYSKPVKEHLAVDESNVLCHVSTSTNDRPENVEGAIEAAVVSSSICSASIVDRVSNDHKCDLKRKFHDTEESDSLSDDMEEQSISAKKVGPPRGGSGSKRSRAAEVHNLSERRRRDRINEKMRSLQELIPNCNKVDKASMLDEAIEYLKSLQLQVQVMSMGAERYMPQMMLPIGMQHMYASHMRQFSPMSVGTGMGFSSSPGYPIMQMPSRLGAQFCSPPSNLQMFGFNGQGWPHAPVASFSLGPPTKSATGSSSSVVGNLNSTQISSSKDAI